MIFLLGLFVLHLLQAEAEGALAGFAAAAADSSDLDPVVLSAVLVCFS